MPTSTEIKNNNNTLIREKTEPNSIPTDVVADQLDASVDYTDQQVPFKVYKAKLAQSGTDNVTAIILKNDTGKTFTYARNSTGSYNFTFSSFYSDLSKVDIYIHLQNGSYAAPQVLIDNLGVLATIETKYWNGTNFVLSDGILQNATIYLVVNN